MFALVLWTMTVFVYAYLKGTNDQSIKDALATKDALIASLQADMKRNTEFAAKAREDAAKAETEKQKQEDVAKGYEDRLNKKGLLNGKDTTLIPRNTCPNVCAADSDFLGVLGGGRVRK